MRHEQKDTSLGDDPQCHFDHLGSARLSAPVHGRPSFLPHISVARMGFFGGTAISYDASKALFEDVLGYRSLVTASRAALLAR